jgi:hypothetical protein
MADDALPTPLNALPFDGAVVVTCPGTNVAVALTPKAARDSAGVLIDAADIAEAQPG